MPPIPRQKFWARFRAAHRRLRAEQKAKSIEEKAAEFIAYRIFPLILAYILEPFLPRILGLDKIEVKKWPSQEDKRSDPVGQGHEKGKSKDKNWRQRSFRELHPQQGQPGVVARQIQRKRKAEEAKVSASRTSSEFWQEYLS